MPKLKITVDRELCIGAGSCIEEAPKTFELDVDDKAIVINPEGNDEDSVLNAAESCPTNAITVINEETGEQLFP